MSLIRQNSQERHTCWLHLFSYIKKPGGTGGKNGDISSRCCLLISNIFYAYEIKNNFPRYLHIKKNKMQQLKYTCLLKGPKEGQEV